MAKNFKNQTVNVGEDTEQREFPYTTSGMYKLVQLLWKNSSVNVQKNPQKPKHKNKQTKTTQPYMH